MNGYETTPEFQSTPPRGWRRWWNGHKRRIRFYFNPLHHEGGDFRRVCHNSSGSGFQSTPPRGWRPFCRIPACGACSISIHSTTRVETGNRGTAPLFMSFQSTPPRGWRQRKALYARPSGNFNPLHHEGGDRYAFEPLFNRRGFQSTPPRGWRQQYYTITTTILQHISTNKSYPTPSNHGQPSLHTRKSVLIVQIFRCESPRKSMFASGSHQNTLYRFTARGQVRISAVLPH